MIDFDAMLDQDVFNGNMCTRCGSPGILIATPRMFGACPRCLAERMSRVRETGVALPDWFLYVQRVAERWVRMELREMLVGAPVTFDDFYPCADCGRVIQVADARYDIDPATNSSPPYCIDCYNIRAGGGE